MFVDLAGKLQVLGAACLMTVCLHTGDGFLHRAVVSQIEFEGFLLRAFGGISPVAFRCFLHTVHIRVLSPAYPYLLEVAATFPVVQGIDGEYLLPLDGCQSQDGSNVLVAVLELGLVEQYLHIGIVDDGFLHDGRIYHVIQLWVTTPAMPWNFLTVLCRLSTRRLVIFLWQVSKCSPPNRTYTSQRIRLSTNFSLSFRHVSSYDNSCTLQSSCVCGQSCVVPSFPFPASSLASLHGA